MNHGSLFVIGICPVHHEIDGFEKSDHGENHQIRKRFAKREPGHNGGCQPIARVGVLEGNCQHAGVHATEQQTDSHEVPVVLQGHSRCEYVIKRVRGTRDVNMFTMRMT